MSAAEGAVKTFFGKHGPVSLCQLPPGALLGLRQNGLKTKKRIGSLLFVNGLISKT